MALVEEEETFRRGRGNDGVDQFLELQLRVPRGQAGVVGDWAAASSRARRSPLTMDSMTSGSPTPPSRMATAWPPVAACGSAAVGGSRAPTGPASVPRSRPDALARPGTSPRPTRPLMREVCFLELGRVERRLEVGDSGPCRGQRSLSQPTVSIGTIERARPHRGGLAQLLIVLGLLSRQLVGLARRGLLGAATDRIAAPAPRSRSGDAVRRPGRVSGRVRCAAASS